MDEKQFRIGNYYKPTDGSSEEYKEVTADDLKAWSLGAVYGKPIPISRDIILKFGAEEQKLFFQFLIWKKGDVVALTIEKDDFKCLYESIEIFMNINCAHLLQNLYFYLSGEELTFK